MNELGNALLVRESEASRLLSVSIAALRRWRREGRGPKFVRCEGCIRYDLRAIEHYLAANSSQNNPSGKTMVQNENAQCR